jgi:hypothetical protein
VSSRLADELAAPYEVGSDVSVSWDPEHTSALSDVPALVL